MGDTGPEASFLGLPLSAEQEAEIHHYIHQRERRGLPPDTQELRSMLHDMLLPPTVEGMADSAAVAVAHVDAERAALLADDCDPIEAREERIAARESEAMKHQG